MAINVINGKQREATHRHIQGHYKVHELGRKLCAYITSGLGLRKFRALDFWRRVCMILHNTESYHQIVAQKKTADKLDPTYARVYTLYTAETPSKYESVKVQ